MSDFNAPTPEQVRASSFAPFMGFFANTSYHLMHPITTQPLERRVEYNYFILFEVIFILVLKMVTLILPFLAPAIIVFVVYLQLCNIGMTIRRCHDLGHTGWLTLILIIPFAQLYFMLAKSNYHANNRFYQVNNYKNLVQQFQEQQVL